MGHLAAPMDFSKAARFLVTARSRAARVLKPWASQGSLVRFSAWISCGFLAGDFLAVGTTSIVAMRFEASPLCASLRQRGSARCSRIFIAGLKACPTQMQMQIPRLTLGMTSVEECANDLHSEGAYAT